MYFMLFILLYFSEIAIWGTALQKLQVKTHLTNLHKINSVEIFCISKLQ